MSPAVNVGAPCGVEIGGDVKMNSSSGVPPCCSSLAGHGLRGKKGDMQGIRISGLRELSVSLRT